MMGDKVTQHWVRFPAERDTCDICPDSSNKTKRNEKVTE